MPTQTTESPLDPPGALGVRSAFGSGRTPLADRVPPRLRRLAADRRTRERTSLAALLAGTALLYLSGLGASGWANSFYAAAAQAGSESWTAFLFGSSDAANAITVDKTPLALWPMALSVRLFGLSSWSLLVPQALEGVAAVGLLHATVRRSTGSHGAGLLAGAVLATTPVAVLMFRFDNPDALLVLLLVGAAWATLRALDSPRAVRWLALGGALVGLAFLTKMLQAFLVLPALALTYGLFAAAPLLPRLGHLLVALGAGVVAGGWWVALVELWPGSRPYIGGSQTDSVLELTLGYNGLGRLTGVEVGSVGRGGGWGTTGLLRMFDDQVGGQVAWLLPAALLLGVAGLWAAHRVPLPGRRPAVSAALVLWLGWLVVTALTFSLMAGIFHAYYTVALAPAIAALVAVGGLVLWRQRGSLVASGVLAGAMALTAVLAFVLLGRTPDWLPGLRWGVLLVGVVAAAALGLAALLPRRLAALALALALVTGLTGPAAYAAATAATPHTGSIPSAGPASASAWPAGGPGARPGNGPGNGPGGGAGRAPGGFPGVPGVAPGTGVVPGAGGATGGLLEGSEPTDAVTAVLLRDAAQYTWVAAAVGSNNASGYQLATREPVLAIGGFNGSDPSPTLAEFQAHVADGEVHWFVAGGREGAGGGPGAGGPAGRADGGSSASTEIAAWVSETFEATTVDGVTLYDLSAGHDLSAGTP